MRFLQSPAIEQAPLKDLGFDPLTNLPKLCDFTSALLEKTVAVKGALLDQEFSAGVETGLPMKCASKLDCILPWYVAP